MNSFSVWCRPLELPLGHRASSSDLIGYKKININGNVLVKGIRGEDMTDVKQIKFYQWREHIIKVK